MGKAKSKTWVLGWWSIDLMSMWNKDYIDAEVPGYFEFGADNLGLFQFGYVQGDVDYRATERGDKPAIEFSFEGGDGADGTPCTGRDCRWQSDARCYLRPDQKRLPVIGYKRAEALGQRSVARAIRMAPNPSLDRR